jgi:hypothetical protein
MFASAHLLKSDVADTSDVKAGTTLKTFRSAATPDGISGTRTRDQH